MHRKPCIKVFFVIFVDTGQHEAARSGILFHAGLPDFSWHNIQNGENDQKYT
jgi:hypothetical protein